MTSAWSLSSSSVTIGSPVSALASARISRPGRAEALERERRRARLVGAAAQHRGARLLDRARDGHRLLARLDRARPGDQAERLVAADRAAGDVEHARAVVEELGGRELVGARDRDDAVDALHPLEARPRARASGSPMAPIAVVSSPGMTSTCTPIVSSRSSHRRDLPVGRVRCHHDHHRPSSRTPSSSAPRWWASSWRTVRVTCARSSSGSWPKSRSSVSRKMMMRSG